MYDSSHLRSNADCLTVQSSSPAADAFASVQPGQCVVMTEGPLTGLQGRVVEVKEQQRFILSVELVSRSVLIEIDQDWVAPLH